MRLNYYRFPEDTDESAKLSEGCAVVLKSGDKVYVDNIPDDKRELVAYVDNEVSGISVSRAKELLKMFGGSAWTYHMDRDGSIFETTEIKVKGNNSKFKYNKHL